MKILITGSTGFIGKALTQKLKQYSNYELFALLNSHSKVAVSSAVASDLSQAELKKLLKDVDVVIHLAARVHLMDDKSPHPLKDFREVNVDLTFNLAKLAAECGVKRFIFLSSIKVNGEHTKFYETFKPTISDIRFKQLSNASIKNQCDKDLDAYALSKFEAEQVLIKLCKESSMDFVIIRPPLVYGNCAKGNFKKMIEWVSSAKLLPFGGVKNMRSIVYIDNLVSLIESCINHPKASNEIFLVSDGRDLSTHDIVKTLSEALGKTQLFFSFHPAILKLLLLLLNKRNIYERLFLNLQVEINKTKELLDWYPRISVEVGLQRTVELWLNSNHKS